MKHFKTFNNYTIFLENTTEEIVKKAKDLKKEKQIKQEAFIKDYNDNILNPSRKAIRQKTWDDVKDKIYDKLLQLLKVHDVTSLDSFVKIISNKKNKAHKYFVDKLKQDSEAKRIAKENKEKEDKEKESLKTELDKAKETSISDESGQTKEEVKENTFGEYSNIAKDIISKSEAPLLSTKLVKQKLDSVKLVQKMLGFETQDGMYGNNTANKIKEFQTKNGLTSDGIVGKSTWSKLLNSKIGSTTKTSQNSVVKKELVDETVDDSLLSNLKKGEEVVLTPTQFREVLEAEEEVKESITVKLSPNKELTVLDNDSEKVKTKFELSNDKVKLSDEDKEKVKALLFKEEDDKVVDNKNLTMKDRLRLKELYKKGAGQLEGHSSELIDILTNLDKHLGKSAKRDAKMYYKALDGIGTADSLLTQLSSLRENESDDYKQSIFDEFGKLSDGGTLMKWIADDYDDISIRAELYRKIKPSK